MITASTVVHPIHFLTLLMSFLPSDGKYTCNSGKWAEAVHALRERYEEKYPEIFRSFHFTTGPRHSTYSKQVSDWLTNLWIGVGTIGGPPYHRVNGLEYIEFPTAFQKGQRNHPLKMVSPEVVALIRQFAKEVTQGGLLNAEPEG